MRESSCGDLGAQNRSVLDVHSLAQQSKASVSALPRITPVPEGTGYEDSSTKSTIAFIEDEGVFARGEQTPVSKETGYCNSPQK